LAGSELGRQPQGTSALNGPIAIYEVHLGSWRKVSDKQWGQRYLTYRELAATLIPYVVEMGYNPYRAAADYRVPL
jgi:1,4-alpha-glucan branching enzyme